MGGLHAPRSGWSRRKRVSVQFEFVDPNQRWSMGTVDALRAAVFRVFEHYSRERRIRA